MNPFALRAAVAISLVAPVAFAAQFKFPTQTFTVPDGFEVELVAGPPLVERPVSASFDDQGRLYVTDSSGSNEKPDKQLANPPHRVVRFEDSDGDGRLDKSIEFADKVMFPQGCLWHEGAVYVAGPPSIWRFTDTDGDGVADKREEWFNGGTLTGCANDIHGPYLGPDGYLYWTKGAFAEQTHTLANGRKVNDRAPHIYRARPDGSGLDVIMTGGMDNPVEIAFTPEGETLFTSTFIDFSQPGFRDGIAHAVYGGVFGKQNDVLEDGRVKRTGPDLLHPFYEAGNAAECGLCRYESAVFGADYRDNFFATTFNLHKVTRHVLRPSGATYASTDSDFVVSDSTDFHPTDVLEDADVSLLVVDTGGWYKLCCPSSQLAKPDLLGAIYRVRRRGAPPVADPRGLTLAWNAMTPSELTILLDDARPAVRNRAMNRIAAAGKAAVAPLASVVKTSASVEARRGAVWALTRIDAAPARDAARLALGDRDQTVRQTALYAASLWRDPAALPALLDALKSDLPAVQRSAAEALGRIGNSRAVPALIAAAASPADRVLEHSVTYALIEIQDWRATAAGLHASSSRAQRASLIALDQMDDGGLQPGQVVSLLDAPDPILKETAWWLAGHHPDWGSALAGYFQKRLATPTLDSAERDDLQMKLAQFSETPAIQALLATTADRATSMESRLMALDAMAKSRMKTLPDPWLTSIVGALESRDAELTGRAIAVARAAPASDEATPRMDAALLRVGRDTSRPAALRVGALAAIHGALT